MIEPREGLFVLPALRPFVPATHPGRREGPRQGPGRRAGHTADHGSGAPSAPRLDPVGILITLPPCAAAGGAHGLFMPGQGASAQTQEDL